MEQKKIPTGGPVADDRRLIVLIPEMTMDAAHPIWKLANTLGARVLLMGLCPSTDEEPALRRQLVTLSALVAHEQIQVESMVVVGGAWPGSLRSKWRAGDAIACVVTRGSAASRRVAAQLDNLVDNLGLTATVYQISGLQIQEEPIKNRLPAALPAWVGSLGVLSGFFWLQLQIIHGSHDVFHSLLLYSTVFLEAGALWVWNSFTG